MMNNDNQKQSSKITMAITTTTIDRINRNDNDDEMKNSDCYCKTHKNLENLNQK